MDKNTLSNYGWIVIAVLVLSVMIALATPFGSFIEQGVRSTTTGLFDTSEKALNVVGMSAGDSNFEDGYIGIGDSEQIEAQEVSITIINDGYWHTVEIYGEDIEYDFITAKNSSDDTVEILPITLTKGEVYSLRFEDTESMVMSVNILSGGTLDVTEVSNSPFAGVHYECELSNITGDVVIEVTEGKGAPPIYIDP